MALVLLGKSFKKVPSRLYYQTAIRKASYLAWPYSVTVKSNLTNPMLIQKQVINPCPILIRSGTTTITIKEYESSRKNTGYWKVERLLGWSLLIMIPTVFALESKELEMALGFVVLFHTYLGCQSMCSDYVRSSVCGKVLPVIIRLFVVIITLTSLAGVYQLVYADIGIVNMIKKFWGIRGKDYVPPKHLTKVEHAPKKKQRFRLFSDK